MNCYNLDRFKNTVDLGAFVETLLDVMDEKASANGETYEETAALVEKNKPFLSAFLLKAAARWHELEGEPQRMPERWDITPGNYSEIGDCWLIGRFGVMVDSCQIRAIVPNSCYNERGEMTPPRMVKRIQDLPLLEIAVHTIYDILYLETDEETGEAVYNADKEWDFPDAISAIAEAVSKVIPRPE